MLIPRCATFAALLIVRLSRLAIDRLAVDRLAVDRLAIARCKRKCGLSLLLTIGGLTSPLHAQPIQVQVAVQEPPYYVGEPVVIQFTAEGFDEQPPPTCALDTDSGELDPALRGQMGAANPSVFSRIVQRNGRTYRTQRVTYQIQFLVTADEPGEYEVGPFRLEQGNKRARVDSVKLSFQAVPLDPEMRVRLVLPDKPVYPDQRVPVDLEWWYAGEFDNVLKLSLYVPLFDQFHFAPDERPSRRAVQLPVNTKEGQLSLPATTREEVRDGRRFVVVTARRTLIPDRIGEFHLGPASATLRQATEWARSRSPFDEFDDLFGGSLLRDMIDDRRSRPARTSLTRAVGQPHTLLVKPFPIDGRPESFAGAVGDGFSIDVSADRTVVRVGDPITLDITLRGNGNLENASLPPLSADGGMDPADFRLPEGDLTGTLADDQKRFRIAVRVADESVGEIPALAYSWFDPETEQYRTSRSKPIALRVMPAQVISANDVVRNQSQPDSASEDSFNGREAPADRDEAGPERSRVALTGANLAIETDPAVVLRPPRATLANNGVVRAVVYIAGFVLVIVALIDRQRRSLDPQQVSQRKTWRRQLARIERAANLPRQQAADEIAAALRVLIAEVPQIDRSAAQAVVADCEAISFAPQSRNDTSLNEAIIQRAKDVATHGLKRNGQIAARTTSVGGDGGKPER